MAMRVIGRDCAISLYDGGAQGASGPTYGSATVCDALAREVRIDDSIGEIDVRVPADTTAKKRPGKRQYRVEIDLAPVSTGTTGLYPVTVLNYGKAVAACFASLGSERTLTGLWTGNHWVSGGDGVQSQTVTLEGPAE